VVSRIGGEEFALILPETDVGGALNVAQKICIAIARPSDLKRPLTLSIGISVLHGTDIEAEALIRQADLALYEAKGKGRDQIRVFEDEGLANEKKL
jgi:diguanylate cyclase (GGDEF)-like protein